jgi:hypothetical protein
MVTRAAAKKAIIISLAALVIVVSGAVLTFLIHYIFTDIYDVPPINIVITQDEDDPLITITRITHNGKDAVNNLHFTLRTPKEIKDYSNFTSVKNVTMNEIPPNVLTASVPKFGPGPGSIIEIYTSSRGAKTIYQGNYSAHAVYDQGSTKVELGPLPWWEDASNQFNTLNVTIRKSILIGTIIIVLSFIAWLITYFFNSLKRIYRDARRILK